MRVMGQATVFLTESRVSRHRGRRARFYPKLFYTYTHHQKAI